MLLERQLETQNKSFVNTFMFSLEHTCNEVGMQTQNGSLPFSRPFSLLTPSFFVAGKYRISMVSLIAKERELPGKGGELHHVIHFFVSLFLSFFLSS